MSNYKTPVYKAMDIKGNWEDDPDGISRFYDYICEMPSGHCIERSVRCFSAVAFRMALARWNKEGNPRGYKYFYDANSNGAYGIVDPNYKAVNERPCEENL